MAKLLLYFTVFMTLICLVSATENESLFNESMEINLTMNEEIGILNESFTDHEEFCGIINTSVEIIIINSSINQNNVSIPITPTINSCNYSFEILPKEEIFEDKIKFKFETNSSNYEIEYWIENYERDIVKKKIITKNTNEKSYSPKDETQIYFIKAKLNLDDCSFEDEKQVFFYSETSPEGNNEEGSRIEILNKATINSSKYIEYQVYRGDTQKSSVYIYKDTKLYTSFSIDKYSSLNSKLYLEDLGTFKTILIDGLGESDSITLQRQNISDETITNATRELPEKEIETPPKKQFFEIGDFKVENSEISFDINSNIDNLTYICYALHLRTKISKEINEKQSSNLQINNSLLSSRINSNIVNLKLTCKYKKSHLKTLKYESLGFDYELQKEELEEISEFTNLNNSSNILSKLEIEEGTKITSKEINEYKSENSKLKENSFYFVFLAVSILLLVFIFRR